MVVFTSFFLGLVFSLLFVSDSVAKGLFPPLDTFGSAVLSGKMSLRCKCVRRGERTPWAHRFSGSRT